MKTNSIIRLSLLSFLFIFITPLAHALEDSGVKNLRQTGKAFASVAREVSPSVVFIQVEAKSSGSAISRFQLPFGNEWPLGDDFFKRFFGDQFPEIPREPRFDKPQNENRTIGQGSGFVFSEKDGIYLTRHTSLPITTLLRILTRSKSNFRMVLNMKLKSPGETLSQMLRL